MLGMFAVFGSWKLRHNEPTDQGDRNLVLCSLRLRADDASAHSIVLDPSDELDYEDGLVLDASGQKIPLTGLTDLWAADVIPLAIVVSEAEELRITHAVTRVDLDAVQFVKAPQSALQHPEAPLWEQIYRFNESAHLYFSNHECFYIKDRETTELEQKFSFQSEYSYFHMCQKIYAALDQREFAGFRPQHGDEFQLWSYDNYLYDILPNDGGDRGYVSMIDYCKEKPRWNDPMYMYKKKVYNEDALERWEKNYENQWVERDKQAMLEEYFGYELSTMPAWRRTRCDVAFESVQHGNIFMVNMDDCRVHDPASGIGRLQQCEIEYLKTRGTPEREYIYQDFRVLINQIENFLSRLGLEPTRTNYSKLSWLRGTADKNLA